ncbi:MAG: hypothetical protein V3V15_08195 [Sphingorhabdus sp.]
MKRLIAIAAISALAACGGSDKDEEIVSGTFQDDKGNKGEYSVRGDDDAGSFSIKTKDGSLNITANKSGNVKLPFGLKMLPGSKIQANVQMNQGPAGTNGSMVSFESDVAPENVIAFYRKQVESVGFKIGTEMKSGKTQMFNATRGGKDNINVTATADDNGKTTGNVIGGTKG